MIESKDLPYNPKFSDNIHNTFTVTLIVYLKIKTFNLLERKDVTISDIVVRTEYLYSVPSCQCSKAGLDVNTKAV